MKTKTDKTETESFDVKVYGHYFVEGKIDHRALFDNRCDAATEKEAALKTLKNHQKGSMRHYKATAVECGGVRQTPGAGRVYYFDGPNPLENFGKESQGVLVK